MVVATDDEAQSALTPGVSTTFEVLAGEIELAGARCIFLDSLIGELMDLVPDDQRGRFVEGLHAVDLLAQHLTGLSAFARRIGANASDDVSTAAEEALRDITLGDLADRMTGALGGQDRFAEVTAGDVDLF